MATFMSTLDLGSALPWVVSCLLHFSFCLWCTLDCLPLWAMVLLLWQTGLVYKTYCTPPFPPLLSETDVPSVDSISRLPGINFFFYFYNHSLLHLSHWLPSCREHNQALRVVPLGAELAWMLGWDWERGPFIPPLLMGYDSV